MMILFRRPNIQRTTCSLLLRCKKVQRSITKLSSFEVIVIVTARRSSLLNKTSMTYKKNSLSFHMDMSTQQKQTSVSDLILYDKDPPNYRRRNVPSHRERVGQAAFKRTNCKQPKNCISCQGVHENKTVAHSGSTKQIFLSESNIECLLQDQTC